jgi:hypothetical protein
MTEGKLAAVVIQPDLVRNSNQPADWLAVSVFVSFPVVDLADG